MCVILCTKINGKSILAKNRDQRYDSSVCIIHEIVNGVEIAYIYDSKDGWVEGMNEHRVGMVVSTLLHNEKIHTQLPQQKFNYNLLIQPHVTNKTIYDIIQSHPTFEGNSILYNHEFIHMMKDDTFLLKKIKPNQVYTNYTKKDSQCKISSFLREKIIKKELQKKSRTIDELANRMNQTYTNIHPQSHPYRDTHYKVNSHLTPNNLRANTTGQLFLNMTDLEFIYFTDIHHNKIQYMNKLPKGYIPKIHVMIKKTEKYTKRPKKIFTKKYLANVEKKYYCKTSKLIW